MTQTGQNGSARYDGLKVMLEERSHTILREVRGKIRVVRAEAGDRGRPLPDPADTAELDIQEDIEFVLIQMKIETLNKINEALARLDEGRYGHCYECGCEIAEARLRALPFAVRCKDCEEERETAIARERASSWRGGTPSLFNQ